MLARWHGAAPKKGSLPCDLQERGSCQHGENKAIFLGILLKEKKIGGAMA